MIVTVMGNVDRKKIPESDNTHIYTTVSGLNQAIIHVTFDNDKISDITFQGRPANPKIMKNKGEHVAHIDSNKTMQDEIKEQYCEGNIDSVGVSYPKDSFFSKVTLQMKQTRCAEHIAKRYMGKFKDRRNVYASSAEHNLMLNHVLQQLNAVDGKKVKFPLSVSINTAYCEQAKRNFDCFDNDSNSLEIATIKMFNDIKGRCEKDDPSKNNEHVEKIKNNKQSIDKIIVEASSDDDNEDEFLNSFNL